MNHSDGRDRTATGPTLVCFALKEEAAPFRKRLGARVGTILLVTGMGRRNSRQRLLAVLRATRPRRVFTCGFAGGLNPGFATGQVLFHTSDAELTGLLAATGAVPATFTCADRIAITRAEKQGLYAATRADAVEMESAEIHSICRERQIPCATVRVISDSADEELPLDFNQLSHPDHRLHYGRLVWAVLKSPGVIPALLQLQAKTKRAAMRLAAVLMQVV